MASTKRIQLTSGALHVESNGDPRGRLVLCVHGLSANCRSFDRYVPVLADAGHHVVAMDLRGRGRSDITPAGSYGWDSHVRDLLEIAGRYGADSFDVIGHSMGGFIGMALAAQYPQRCGRLVLIDAVGAPEPSALLSIAKSVGRLGQVYPSASAVLSHMQAAGTIAPWDAFWDSYFEWELESVDDTVRVRTDLTAVREDSAYGSQRNVYELWPQLSCPVLLVRATRTMAPGGGLVVSRADAERFATEARDATVVNVDAAHYSILLNPPAISVVERFIKAPGTLSLSAKDAWGIATEGHSTFPCHCSRHPRIMFEPVGNSFCDQPEEAHEAVRSTHPPESPSSSRSDRDR